MASMKWLGVGGLIVGLMARVSNGAGGIRLGGEIEARQGVVVSASGPASVIGVEVLQRGGTAVDAAVATAFALAVTFPEAGNIGGGGFMLVRPGGVEEPVFFDYRETAPAAATKDMFASGKPSQHLLVGTPGTVHGLSKAHQRFGKLPWKDLVQPAVRLADEGFALDKSAADSLNEAMKKPGNSAEFVRVFAKPDGSAWKEGERLVQKDLGKTLQLIADVGPDAFYSGPVADALVAEMKSGGGLITHEDLSAYQAKVRKPLHGTFRGYDIFVPAPPSSGGGCMIEMLNILENFDLKKEGRWNPLTLHLMVEAMRRGYLDRARYLGDSDFVKIPEHLTSKEYAAKLGKGIDLTHATRSDDLAGDIQLAAEGTQTTHFSVIDKDGMAVANTYTLEQSYGGHIVVKGAGFLLNNEMGDFNPRPGVTDRKGMIGTEANQVAPGKRMLSSMTPTIVVKNGRTMLITGSPGGRTIINTVFCVTFNVLEFDMPLKDAVAAPRMHHQWFADQLRVEAGLINGHADAVEALKKMGHEFAAKPESQGHAHSIYIDPATGAYIGVGDQRRHGQAAGY